MAWVDPEIVNGAIRLSKNLTTDSPVVAVCGEIKYPTKDGQVLGLTMPVKHTPALDRTDGRDWEVFGICAYSEDYLWGMINFMVDRHQVREITREEKARLGDRKWWSASARGDGPLV